MRSAALTSRPPMQRMLHIHEELRRGATTNCSDLARQLKVSRKTILRDVAFMHDRLDLPVEFDVHGQTYRYTHPVESFPTIQHSRRDLVNGMVTRRALDQYRKEPYYRQLVAAFDKVTSVTEDRSAFSPSGELEAVSFKSFGLGKTDPTTFNQLGVAVLKRFEVEFDYRRRGEKDTGRRRVRPYHISLRDNLWYLVGFDIKREALRTFALPRITKLSVRPERFARPKDFSPEKYFAGALGVVTGSARHHIVIRFSATVADRILEREWHPSQKLRPAPDGSLTVEVQLASLWEAERWVLSWGADAEALEPPELRQSIARQLAKLNVAYGVSSALPSHDAQS